MSPANVYRFFKSEKATNEAVAEQLMGQVEAAIEGIADRDAPAAERLAEIIATMHRMNKVPASRTNACARRSRWR